MKKLLFILILFANTSLFAQVLGPYNVTSTTPVEVNNGYYLDGKYAVQFIGDTSGDDFNGATLNIQISLDGGTTWVSVKEGSTVRDITDDDALVFDFKSKVRIISDGACDVNVYFAEITQRTD